MSIVEDTVLAWSVGGSSLYVLTALLCLAWCISLQHMYFLRFGFGKVWRTILSGCFQSRSFDVPRRDAIRCEILSRVNSRLFAPLYFLKVVTVVSPLCGLLGTVTGMIEVFDVVQRVGTGNVQALASGISQATFSTAAGIVVSLMALTMHALLQRQSRRVQSRCEEELEA